MNNIHIGYSNDVIIDIANGEYSLYLRKSRADLEAEERGEGETLARHEKMLIELARRYGFSIGKIYREIVSGESIESRPVVQELLRDVESGRWKGVLVVEVERLARGDTMDQGRVAKSFKFSNTKIITPIKIYDPNNEFDEEYFEFGLFMSRREYKTINRRLQRGRVSSVKEGKFVGSIAPYGYDRVKIKKDKGFTLAKNDEAPTVEKIFNLYAYNDIAINEVARQLNIGGYKFDKKTKTFPVFINYDKADDISDTIKYEDHFTSNQTLIAISKAGRSLSSEDVQNFLYSQERGIDVELFVRKNKDDKIVK